MATTTFSGPVRSEKGFQVATKNSSTGAITTRYSSQLPDLTGLSLSDVSEEIINKYKNAPYRAPKIIILVNTFKEHPKVPSIEQKLSTATAAQNISLALNAMKYSCIWRTGKLAFNKTIQEKLGLSSNQEILGYLYVGTEVGKKKKIPSLDIDDFVSYL